MALFNFHNYEFISQLSSKTSDLETFSKPRWKISPLIYQRGFEPETRERFKELLKPEKPGEIFCKTPSPCWSKELYSVSASIQDLILIFS